MCKASLLTTRTRVLETSTTAPARSRKEPVRLDSCVDLTSTSRGGVDLERAGWCRSLDKFRGTRRTQIELSSFFSSSICIQPSKAASECVFLFLLVRDSSLIARPLLNLLPRFLFLKRDADEPDATPTHIQYPVATPTTQHKSALLLSSSSCSRRACHRAAPPPSAPAPKHAVQRLLGIDGLPAGRQAGRAPGKQGQPRQLASRQTREWPPV